MVESAVSLKALHVIRFFIPKIFVTAAAQAHFNDVPPASHEMRPDISSILSSFHVVLLNEVVISVVHI